MKTPPTTPKRRSHRRVKSQRARIPPESRPLRVVARRASQVRRNPALLIMVSALILYALYSIKPLIQIAG